LSSNGKVALLVSYVVSIVGRAVNYLLSFDCWCFFKGR